MPIVLHSDILRMIDAGLGERLLFGTHTPLFTPLAGFARVVTDLSEADAAMVLGGNATRVLGG